MPPRASIVQPPAFLFDKGPPAFGLEHAVFGGRRAFGGLTAQFFPGLPGSIRRLAFALLEGGKEAFPGELAVDGLGAGVLDRHCQVSGQVPQRDAGGDLVHILAARAGRAAEGFLQLRFIQMGDGFHGSGTALRGAKIGDGNGSHKK